MGTVNSKNKAILTIGAGVGVLYWIYGHKLLDKLFNNDAEEKEKPIRGLKNVGSTCYLNAVLQALSACTYFSAWLANKDDQNKSDFPPCLHHHSQYRGFDYPLIAVVYRAILVINRVIGNDEDDSYLMNKVPKDIIRMLRHIKINFINQQEQDTLECLQCILLVLQNEVSKSIHRRQCGSVDCILDEDDASEVSGELISVSEIEIESDLPSSSTTAVTSNPHSRLSISEPISNIGSWDVVHDPKKAVNGIYSKRKTSVDATVPVALQFPFKGLTASILQCLQCLHTRKVKFETFEALTLVIPNAPTSRLTIGYLLDELQKPALVTQVDCEGCSRKQGRPTKSVFSKTMYFARLPSILCIHVLQSEWRPDGLTKRTEFVKYEERMNLATLHHWNNSFVTNELVSTEGEAGGDTTHLNKASKLASLDILYDLKAVIAHCGDADSGHFVTCRRIPDTPDNVGVCRWAYASDETIVALEKSEPFHLKPYLLFYERSPKSKK